MTVSAISLPTRQKSSRFPLGLLLLLAFAGVLPLSGQTAYMMTTVAGSDRVRDGKLATTAPLRAPLGFVEDSAGNIYIADRDDNRVRKVGPDGIISTLAGTGWPGFLGDGGPADSANLRYPNRLALSPDESILYIADRGNYRIRAVDLETNVITTVAGTGVWNASGDGGPALLAGFEPFDIAVDKDGNIFVADFSNHRLRRIDALDKTIETIAGLGVSGLIGENTPAIAAAVNYPTGVAVAPDGVIYFSDSGNARVRSIDTHGLIHTFAGGGQQGAGVPAVNAKLTRPEGVDVDSNGVVLIADFDHLYRVADDGILQQIADATTMGFGGDGGSPSAGKFSAFSNVSTAPNGDILLGDFFNYRVRQIRDNVLSTIAGVGIVNDVPATQTFLNTPSDIIPDGQGGLWFADSFQNEVRGIEAGQIKRIFGDGYIGDELTRTYEPSGIARDANGSLYIADTGNHRVLRYEPGGTASVVAGGNGPGYSGESGLATSALFDTPTAVAVGRPGLFFVSDTGNCRVRRITDGAIRTVVGNGSCDYSGDGGPATDAGIGPLDLALVGSGDGEGTLYITDSDNNRIRKVDLATGIITTVVGSGTAGYSGDGGPAEYAQIAYPTGMDMDQEGNLYFADYFNAVLRKVDTNGIISTIAGVPGYFFSLAEIGPAQLMPFNPVGVAVLPDGTLYVTDQINDRVRKLTPAIPTSQVILSGNNATGAPGDQVTLRLGILEADGFGVPGVPVSFAVTSGTATLSSSSVATALNGVAQVQLTLGDTPGPVTVTASVPGLAPVTFHLMIVIPLPTISPNGLVGAGLSVPSIAAASTGGILSVFGTHFGGPAVFQKVSPDDLVDGKVPTNFMGICVEMDGTRAPVFGASSTQVNFQSVAVQPGATIEVIVISGCDTPDETRSAPMQIGAQSAAPEFFYYAASQTGENPVAAADAATGAIIAPADLFPGSGYQPAQPGQTVTLYATGFGATDPAVDPGTFFASAASVTGTVKVYLNGEELPADNILYVGITPNSPGLYQVNLTLPANLASGNLTIVIEINGIQSSPGAYLAVDSGQ